FCLLLAMVCLMAFAAAAPARDALGVTRNGRTVTLRLADPAPEIAPVLAEPPPEIALAMAGPRPDAPPAAPPRPDPVATGPVAGPRVAAASPPAAASAPVPASAAPPTSLSLALDDMPLRSVLQGLAEQAGRSLVIGPEVQGEVSATLSDVSFEEALRAILATTPYGYNVRDGVWSIGTLAVETRVLSLTYVGGDAVKEALTPFLSEKGRVEALTVMNNGDVAGTPPKSKLVITDIPDRLDRIEAVIRSLDVRPRQVRIEARMIETTVGHDASLGINWNLDVSARGAAAPTTFPFRHDGAPASDYAVTGDTQGTGTETGGRQFLPGEFFPTAQRSDFVFGIMDASQLGVAVQALQSDVNANVLATPTITTTDGRKAQVLVGQQIPVPVYERQQETGVLEITGYTQQEVGISLDVTPHVGRDGEILMEVTPSTSDIVEFIGQFKDRPITKTRVARTQVVVREGQTLAIAGLLSESEFTTHSKVPLLGDIPLLGHLFRHTGTEKRKVELLVFITPTLLE
ncbi:MAG: type II secretion system protein GspD, partial [Candidatus Krumholzibacteriia bacterium]